tara:strand:+ start:27615 stop:28061 length:447 start_codon:yes stop_codon:yes gene_type:complete
MKIKVKKITECAKVPEKNTLEDSGYDFFIIKDGDFNGEVFVLKPGERKVFSTGITMELPSGYGMILKDRSGLAVKSGLHVLAGVIDNGYRGEVKICIVNLGQKTHTFSKGQKVAQGVLNQVPECEVEEVAEVNDDTERGNKGFGSSGQ